MRWPRKRLDIDVDDVRALPVEMHVTRSHSGIDALDRYLTGRTVVVRERAVDADGDEYVVVDDPPLLAYVDQLEFVFLDTRSPHS